MTSAAIDDEYAVGDSIVYPLSVAVTAENVGTAAIYLQVRDDGGTFVVPAIGDPRQPGTIDYQLAILASAAIGTRTGTLSVRACKDAACAAFYDGATASSQYTLRVIPVPDWITWQGNAGHSGYVPIRLDSSRFAAAWEYVHPYVADRFNTINPVVTGGGKVYATLNFTDNTYSARFVASTGLWFDENSASPNMLCGTGTNILASSPAYASGAVVFHEESWADMEFRDALWLPLGLRSQLRSCALTGGTAAWTTATPGFSYALGPVPHLSSVYRAAPEGAVAAQGVLDGLTAWTKPIGAARHSAPAVDGMYVYQYGRGYLNALDRVTGNLSYSVKVFDSQAGISPQTAESSYGAPVVGAKGNILVMSPQVPAVSMIDTVYAMPFLQSPWDTELASVDTKTRTVAWAKGAQYASVVVANGVVYALSAQRLVIDALDETTGALLWTIENPRTWDSIPYAGNMIVTKTHLFVSGGRNVYAYDLATRRQVWSHPRSGYLALSANRRLYIAAPGSTTQSNEVRIVAIRLQ